MPEGRRTLNRAPRILLLATVPPRDDRPDAVGLHLTAKSYREMVDMALSVVKKIPSAELLVKLHPRAPDDPLIRAGWSGSPGSACGSCVVGLNAGWPGPIAC